MRIGALICLFIFVAWVAMALLELWFGMLSSGMFWKLTVTAGALFIVILAISLVIREYTTEKKLKDDGYIDS
jgi:hypothetical protein